MSEQKDDFWMNTLPEHTMLDTWERMEKVHFQIGMLLSRHHVFSSYHENGYQVAADVCHKRFIGGDLDECGYVGLCAELAFYHRFKETMRLVPALDSGDHVDFVGVLKDKRIKIDVTTSLESKKRIWQHFASDNAHLIAVVNEAKNWCRFYQADKVQGEFREAGQKKRYKLHT